MNSYPNIFSNSKKTMKIYHIMTILLTVRFVDGGRMSTGWEELEHCNVFSGKFGTYTNQYEPRKVAFSGEVSILSGSTDAVVKFRYSDDDFYNNSTFFGLVTEDGQNADNVCLQLNLFKYTNASFSDPVVVQDLPIQSDKNDQKKWRYYLITLKTNDFGTRLIKTESATHYLYTGYYGLTYYSKGTKQIQYTHLFIFELRVNKKNDNIIETTFFSLNDQQARGCYLKDSPICNVKAESQLSFCSDSDCTSLSVSPKIHLNDQFYVLHQLAISDRSVGYTFSNSVAYYVADGLLIRANFQNGPVYSSDQAIYHFKATVAWEKLTIRVTTQVRTTRGIEENLPSLTWEVQATSTQIDCILNSNEQCASCDEIWIANSDVPIQCYSCILTVFSFVLTLFFV